MNVTTSLLYLLLLYAVLDKGNTLSLTTGLIIAFVILLLNCFCMNRIRCCNRDDRRDDRRFSDNVFSVLNGF
ncbi:MAG: hypothetical protein ACI4QL_03700 [Candidatus Fimimonas sp.]